MESAQVPANGYRNNISQQRIRNFIAGFVRNQGMARHARVRVHTGLVVMLAVFCFSGRFLGTSAPSADILAGGNATLLAPAVRAFTHCRLLLTEI